VPRTKEFDEKEALNKAMHLFWGKGYARTSVRDLVEHTGVAHAGLYKVFRDKRSLFKRALEEYSSENIGNLFSSLETEDSGKDSIEELFKNAIVQMTAGNLRNGCFLCNSASEFADTDEEVHQIVIQNFKRQKDAFENAITNGIAAGEIAPSKNVNELADMMVATLSGLSVLGRSGAPFEVIENTSKSIQEMLQSKDPVV